MKLLEEIGVREVIALLSMMLFMYLSVTGKLEVNFIQTVVIAVVSWYFGGKTALDQVPEKNQSL